MNEETQISYYSIIPATVRYNKELKANEKLLYGEITALSNKNGYCYAKNRYFANLYGVNIETVSRWLSHLQSLGLIQIEIIRNSNKEVVARNIYIMDIPYCQKNQYPSLLKYQESIDKKVKVNNIKYNIDDLFNLIIKKHPEISNDFYAILERLEFLYTKDILKYMQADKIQMLKEIVYVLFDLYSSNLGSLLSKASRESLLNLYILAQENSTEDKLSYFKKSIINKYGS